METGIRLEAMPRLAPTSAALDEELQYRLVRVADGARSPAGQTELEGALNARGREGWRLSAAVPVDGPTRPGGTTTFGVRGDVLLIFERTATRGRRAP